MSEEHIPFYPVAILGFRQWALDVDTDPEEARLLSWISFGVPTGRPPTERLGRTRYPLDEDGEDGGVLTAVCRWGICEPETIPSPRHQCGIYSYSTPARLRGDGPRRIGTDLRRGPSRVRHYASSLPAVAGVIAAWGRRDLWSEGFRAQKAKVMALFEHDPAYAGGRRVGVSAIPRPPGRCGRSSASNEADPDVLRAFEEMCAANAVPVLPREALLDDEDVRAFAEERDLALMEDLL